MGEPPRGAARTAPDRHTVSGIPPPAENQAHVDALEAVVAGRYARIVIAPRDGMPTTYALTAWRRLQRFDAIDEPSMRAFIAAYHGTDNHAR